LINWLNYHHLFYFRTIANEGGIAKAALKLRLGQPTLSTQLKQFEESLGKKLFERKNRRLVLTEHGKIALEYANEVFKLGDEMIEAIQDRLISNRTHVQIGALDSVPKQLIMNLTLHSYKAGNCAVSILEGKGDELFRELFSHRLDMILSNYPPPITDQQGVSARSIAKLDVIVCGAPHFKHLKKGFPQSISGKPFILPTLHSKLRHDLDHYFKMNQIQPDVVAETQDTGLQKLLGAAGVGLIPIAEFDAEELVREKKLVNLGRLKNVTEEIWLISASRKIENPIVSKLMKTIQLG
jgi:LysR family transcriptional regulator, transcriptional activator of nhaA